MIRCLATIVVWSLLSGFSHVDAASLAQHGLDVQGHRGCLGLMPGNSMPAFRKAIELGVTTLELDVHSTADRVLVAHHDAKLNMKRCVDSDGRKLRGKALHSLTWEQLQGIDCGWTGRPAFPEQARAAAGIPRLDDVLSLSDEAGYPVRFSIEIKPEGDKGPTVVEIAGLLVDAVRRHALVQRTTVQSFSVDALVAVHEIEPALSLAVLVRSPAHYDSSLARSGAGILSPKAAGLRESDVRRLQERGVAVIPWTVNRPEQIRRMIDWGVDGIVSDYPDRVIDLLRERESAGLEGGGE